MIAIINILIALSLFIHVFGLLNTMLLAIAIILIKISI
jgi:hypothetical protein